MEKVEFICNICNHKFVKEVHESKEEMKKDADTGMGITIVTCEKCGGAVRRT